MRAKMVALALLGAACSGASSPHEAAPTSAAAAPAFPMERCVNLGNALEAPQEGTWGYTIRREHLALIAAAGFEGVRVPVRWDVHAGARPPYLIAPAFMARVEEVVDWALAEGLMVQLDVHHYEALNAAPAGPEAARFLSLWRQIAARFQDRPPALMFEVLNEPYGEAWTPQRLMTLQSAALAQIRRTNPDRLVILGGLAWNNISGLEGWSPPADPHIAVSVHHYEPHAFTHQNAPWLGAEAPRWTRPWGRPGDFAAIEAAAREAGAYARRFNLPVQLGEFGVINTAPPAERAGWLSAMRTAFEGQGIGWCVWDFAAAFNLYDPAAEAWVPGLREALGLTPAAPPPAPGTDRPRPR